MVKKGYDTMQDIQEHEPCDDAECQECCCHDEYEHGTCIDCGLDLHDQKLAEWADHKVEEWKERDL